MIAELLAYSQVDTAGEPGPVDLGAVAGDVVGSFAQEIAETGAVVEVDQLPVVVGRAAQLHLVFANLIGNALKYRDPVEPPRIRVSSERGPRHVVVSVADNGVGIDAEHAGTVFGMYSRGARTGRQAGHGIGLALCRRAVERHGGEIWVEPAPGEGSIFRFTLPAGRAASDGAPGGPA